MTLGAFGAGPVVFALLVLACSSRPSATPDPRCAEIVAAAKKRIAADRAVIANQPGVARALDRQRRQRVDSGMEARLVPAGMHVAALDKASRAAAEEVGLVVVALEVTAAPEPEAVPAEHRGSAPYAYRREQLFVSFPFTVRFGGATKDDVGDWLTALDRAADTPLPFVFGIERERQDAVVRGGFLEEVDVTPPRHIAQAMTIKSLAADLGIAPPPPRERFDAGQLQVLDRLIAEHAELMPRIDEALVLLGRSHLEAERFRLYRRAVETIGKLVEEKRKDERH